MHFGANACVYKLWQSVNCNLRNWERGGGFLASFANIITKMGELRDLHAALEVMDHNGVHACENWEKCILEEIKRIRSIGGSDCITDE